MLTKLELSPGELNKLNYERYHYPSAIVQKRLHSLYIKAITGYTNQVVCQISGAHPNSFTQWITIYKEQGFDGLCRVYHRCDQSLLENEAVSIKELFTQQPPRSIDEAIIKIKEMSGIERSRTRVRAFMKRHQFRFLKTGHIPSKVNTTAQKNWVEETLKPAVEAAQNGEIYFLFMDAALPIAIGFILQPFLCCLWCIKRVFIKASAGRNRINVLGAVNAIT